MFSDYSSKSRMDSSEIYEKYDWAEDIIESPAVESWGKGEAGLSVLVILLANFSWVDMLKDENREKIKELKNEVKKE